MYKDAWIFVLVIVRAGFACDGSPTFADRTLSRRETHEMEARKRERRKRLQAKRVQEERDRPFQCPTCDRDFRYLSAFLQHVESTSCEEGYDGGRMSIWGLLRQLRRNLGWDEVEMYGRLV